MASVLGSILLLTSTAGTFAQDPLQHAGEDCFNDCWKSPGFCEEFCGAGNACCKRGDLDSDPKECRGSLTYLAATLEDGTGAIHECVKAAFLPGQAPVAVPTSNNHVTEQAQCIDFMAGTGCGWTNKQSCPGQKLGWAGEAHKDDSIAYKCCCTNNLWTQSATQGEVLDVDKSLTSTAQCENYMVGTGCSWTGDDSCPGQPIGRSGLASNDGSLGYTCCCLNAMWATGLAATTTSYDPNAFNVDHSMGGQVGMEDTNLARPTLVPENADNGFAVSVGGGSRHGTDIKVPQHNPDFMYNHDGVNVRVNKIAHVDPDSNTDEHHGPIHNTLSKNDAMSQRDGCVAGICSDLGGVAPGSETAQTLPSYSVSVEGDLKDPTLDMQKIDGTVDTHIVYGGGTTILPPPAIMAKEAAPVVTTTVAAAQESSSSGSSGSLTDSSGSTSSGSLTDSSGDNTLMICLILLALVCVCAGIAAGVGYMFMGKKKKRQTTDRENFLKNDFIERQPVYEDSAEPVDGETEPMMKAEPMTQEQIQPTESFPVQVAPLAPMAVGPAISFPGMPTIGQPMAAPMTYQSYAMPQAASMNVTGLPQYGNYAATSMVMAPTYQSQMVAPTYQMVAPTYSSGIEMGAPMMVAPTYSSGIQMEMAPQAGSQFEYR